MDSMDEFKQIFFTECAELLVDMEERLLKLEEGVTDKEQLNAIFRCAHSIKGGSGAFGLDAIMQFTHVLEALLDKMRDGILLPTRESIDTLLKSADIVTQMLAAAQEGRAVAQDFGAEIKARLKSLADGGQVADVAISLKTPEIVAEQHYTISFKPHEELFASGNDPLLILRELARLGATEITADSSRVPPLEEISPTQCYLSW